MRAIVAGVILVLCGSSLAAAQPVCTGLKGCACAAEIPPSAPIAELSQISGNVLVAREAGYSAIHAPTGLGLNDQISVGGGGKARLSMAGQCNLSLIGPQKIVIRREGACACAGSLTTEAAVDVGTSGADLALPADGAGSGGTGNANGGTGGGGNDPPPPTGGAGPFLFGALVLGGGAAALLLTQHQASP